MTTLEEFFVSDVDALYDEFDPDSLGDIESFIISLDALLEEYGISVERYYELVEEVAEEQVANGD